MKRLFAAAHAVALMALAFLLVVPAGSSASYHGSAGEYSNQDHSIAEPSHLAYIFDKGVYFIDYIDEDIFFHLGKWYRRVDGAWSRGASYRGPWEAMALASVPTPLIELPEDYRTSFERYGSVPYRYVVGSRKSGKKRGYYYPRDYSYRGYYSDPYYYSGYRGRRNYYSDRRFGLFIQGRNGRFAYRIGSGFRPGFFYLDHGRHGRHRFSGNGFILRFDNSFDW